MSLIRFLNSVRKHWWALMSCAVFTLLGIWVLYANKSNAWTLQATFGLAGFCLFWACFLAWQDEEKKVKKLEAEIAIMKALPNSITEQHIHFPAPLPAPMPPRHNVHCLGVEVEDISVIISFQNVPVPGEPVGDFNHARLCIEYMDGLTGISLVTVFPARWIEESYDNSIGITPRRAFLAGFYGSGLGGWRALPEVEGISELSHKERVDGLPLPSECLLVKATLVGDKNLTLAPIVGFLTLNDDGQATWKPSVL